MNPLEGIEPLDDATRPEAPRLEGLTPAQKGAGQHLKAVHDHLRENMDTLRTLIASARAGTLGPHDARREAETLAMAVNYRRFGTLCGRHCHIVHLHHSIEDEAIFPPLSEKGAAWAKVTRRLREEHDVIHVLLTRTIAALEALAANPDADRFDAVHALYQRFEAVLASHLDYEEESIGDALGYFRIVV